MFYSGYIEFSYTAYQWIEVDAVKIGMLIHHNMCGPGGERRVKFWVLDHKSEKNLHISELMFMNLSSTQLTSFMDVICIDILVPKIIQ